MATLGIQIDNEKNSHQSDGAFAISSETSPVSILLIPTNEELEITLQTMHV